MCIFARNTLEFFPRIVKSPIMDIIRKFECKKISRWLSAERNFIRSGSDNDLGGDGATVFLVDSRPPLDCD